VTPRSPSKQVQGPAPAGPWVPVPLYRQCHGVSLAGPTGPASSATGLGPTEPLFPPGTVTALRPPAAGGRQTRDSEAAFAAGGPPAYLRPPRPPNVTVTRADSDPQPPNLNAAASRSSRNNIRDRLGVLGARQGFAVGCHMTRTGHSP
jgi:hypothetical protein